MPYRATRISQGPLFTETEDKVVRLIIIPISEPNYFEVS